MDFPKVFSRSRRDRVTTIEASNFHDDGITLPGFKGMFTIRNINPDTSDDLFYFHPGLNVIEGYVESSNASSLNLIDGKKKIVKSICNSFYHSILDDFSEILYALEKHPDHEVIIDISDIFKSLHRDNSEWDFFNMFVKQLVEDGVSVKIVELKKYDIIYMDDFRIVEFIYESGKKSNLVYEFFKKMVTDKDIKPTKNVFVSRGMLGMGRNYEVEGLSYTNDNRMEDHEALESYFADLGYEIIHAEKFSSFQEQLDYFYSAKTMVSLTGSGLTNAAFMQPGGIMFEIVTPLVVAVPFPGIPKDITDPFYVQEIHNFYKNLAYYQNHTYACVQNPNRSIDEFKATMENTPGLKAFLDRND
jgi:hypothetical protein